MKTHWRSGVLIAFLVCVEGAAPFFYAQAITVSPVKIDVTASPGDTKSGTIQITNTNNLSQSYSIFARRFVPQGEDGQQRFIEQGSQDDLSHWIVTDVRQITLAPQEIRIVRYEVRVPRTAIPGGYYAALFFSTQPTDQASDRRVGTNMSVGVLFFAQISGEISERVTLQSFVRLPSLVYAPMQFEARFKNEGNIHVRPRGSLLIQNSFGRVIWRQPFNLEEKIVLPNSIRRFEFSWFDPWALGRYTAHLEVVYGSRGSLVSSPIAFWSASWRTVLVYLGAVAILGAALRMRYTRRVRS